MTTMSSIRKLDRAQNRELVKFLQLGQAYGDPPPFPLRPEYEAQLPEMAAKWKIAEGELRDWVKLRKYIFAAAVTDCEDLEPPCEFANRLEIPKDETEEFVEYVLDEIRQVQEDMKEDDDDVSGSGLLAEDWDIESDLLEEAARIGRE